MWYLKYQKECRETEFLYSTGNEQTVLEQYCTEKISHKANALPFMTVREVYKYVCHLKQSNTKGTDGLDGKILRLSAPFIAKTLSCVCVLLTK